MGKSEEEYPDFVSLSLSKSAEKMISFEKGVNLLNMRKSNLPRTL